jgi:hypothetical protein
VTLVFDTVISCEQFPVRPLAHLICLQILVCIYVPLKLPPECKQANCAAPGHCDTL